MLPKTKIIATLGPVSFDKIPDLEKEGVSIFRINGAHVNPEKGREIVGQIRSQAPSAKIMLDLAGPKIRVGKLWKEPLCLSPGARVRLVGKKEGCEGEIPIVYDHLEEELGSHHRVFLADGSIQIEILGKSEKGLEGKVIYGGYLLSRKGVNFPDIPTHLPCLTEKDKEDLEWGIQAGVDMFSLSFVRQGEDVKELKKRIQDLGGKVPVIAKLEKPQALENLSQIMAEADGVMVARGDLGIEVAYQEIGIHQRRIIQEALIHAKPVITATQLLLSMVEHPFPTRAEVTDITHAVWEGTDCLMVSDETAGGKYPKEAVRVLREVIQAAEKEEAKHHHLIPFRKTSFPILQHSVCYGAYSLAERVGAKGILASTEHGSTPRILASYRPKQPIYAFTNSISTHTLLSLCRGVHPVLLEGRNHGRAQKDEMVQYILQKGLLQKGDPVVLIGTSPFESGEKTNWMEVIFL
ncbi:MAG: pyruvate kinase [Planctomycetota bacterium]|nr:MAG: pyruvate kinase [Planctomycetota bacterium]